MRTPAWSAAMRLDGERSGSASGGPSVAGVATTEPALPMDVSHGQSAEQSRRDRGTLIDCAGIDEPTGSKRLARTGPMLGAVR